MSNFVTDETELPYPKTDLRVLAPTDDPTKHVVAQDWNTVCDALDDIRDYINNELANDLADIATSGSASDLTTGTLPIARIADGDVTYAKIQDVSATDKVLGRSSSGSGVVEEITCTAAGRALLDDADASAQRTTLGLAAIASTGSADDLSSGTVPTARLGSGTANATTFLRGDQTYAVPVDNYNGILQLGSVALGATVNDWAPAGYAGETHITVATSTGGGTVITGLNLGSYQVDGKVVTIQQTGANALTYSSESAGSSANNRLRVGPHTAGQYAAVTLRYVTGGGLNRWIRI